MFKDTAYARSPELLLPKVRLTKRTAREPRGAGMVQQARCAVRTSRFVAVSGALARLLTKLSIFGGYSAL